MKTFSVAVVFFDAIMHSPLKLPDQFQFSFICSQQAKGGRKVIFLVQVT